MPKEGGGSGGKKSTKHQTAEEVVVPELTEQQLQNIQSVQFTAATVKSIISCHSGSILSDPEPYVELADTIEKKARDLFNNLEEENGHTGKISRSKLLEMLGQFGYDLNQDVIKTIIAKACLEEEIDERGWLTFLERYQAPSYYFGQRLRQFCGRGQIQELTELLCRGCDVNCGDGEGLTSLHYAAEANYPEVIQKLSDLTGSRLIINAQDKYGWTPLHSACHHGNIDCVKLLIKLGANVQLTERVGKTALHLAVAQARNGICDYLLAHGANVNAPDQHGMTPLHEAAYKQNEKTYQLLCSAKGCDLTSVDSFGYTAEKYLLLNQNSNMQTATGTLLS